MVLYTYFYFFKKEAFKKILYVFTMLFSRLCSRVVSFNSSMFFIFSAVKCRDGSLAIPNFAIICMYSKSLLFCSRLFLFYYKTLSCLFLFHFKTLSRLFLFTPGPCLVCVFVAYPCYVHAPFNASVKLKFSMFISMAFIAIS